ncbi:MAG: thermonuclease family protein [Nitrospira sp.]|nr:thermonuclease family protein [Nitrospira sp.]
MNNAHHITVIDGDTIRIGKERIRLRGIDAPELSEPGGWAATQRLTELLRTGSIQLIPRGRDMYDRIVADVFVNGQNVAELLKREGFTTSRHTPQPP